MTSSSVVPDLSFLLLEKITDGFSSDRLIGIGGFGKVYKGVHNNGEEIAVKVLHDMIGLDDKIFMNEFKNLQMLKHPNIVRLVGCCNETRKKYVHYEGRLVLAEEIKRALCFEYLRNGSLDNYLSDEYSGQDWNTRYKIIKGICLGLKYLHEDLEASIYHLDLKPANILLCENMEPKIADFGLSRLFGEEKTRITQSQIGTFGYLPPEYIDRNMISNKLDVFSLGVIVIKIITGRDGYNKSDQMPPQDFIRLVQTNWRNRLHEPTDTEQIKQCMEIALSCVEIKRCNRPTIGEIVHKLSKMETMFAKLSPRPRLPHWLRNNLVSPRKEENDSEASMEIQQQHLQTAHGHRNSPIPLRHHLKAIVERSCGEWQYAIFWRSSIDLAFQDPLLSWGDGYYKSCDDDKSGKNQCHSAAQDINIKFLFQVSMTKPFPQGFGLPGMALFTGQPSWTAAGLSDVPCSRAREACASGFRTMVCVPVSIGIGVIELGSTQILSQTTEGLDKLRSLIDSTGLAASWKPMAGGVSGPPFRAKTREIEDAQSGPLLKLSLGQPQPAPRKIFPVDLTLFNNNYEDMSTWLKKKKDMST